MRYPPFEGVFCIFLRLAVHLETPKENGDSEKKKNSTNFNGTVFVLNLIVWLFAPLMLSEIIPTSLEALLRVEIPAAQKTKEKGGF